MTERLARASSRHPWWVLLGWLGAKPPEGGYVLVSRICTIYYFAHFLLVMPLVGLFETPKPLPASIGEPVLNPAE